MFKPSADSASLLDDIEHQFFCFGFGFFAGDVIMWACLCHFLAEVPGPGHQPNAALY